MKSDSAGGEPVKKKAARKKPAKKKVAKKKAPAKKKAAKKSKAKKGAAKKRAAKSKKKAKPAAAAPASPSFDELLQGCAAAVQETARSLRDLVLRELPEAEEVVYLQRRIALYRDREEVCGIQPVGGGCRLYLRRAGSLADPAGLLRGARRDLRHVALAAGDALPEEHLLELLAEGRQQQP